MAQVVIYWSLRRAPCPEAMPTKPLYRAEHVGSLLRPLELLEARDAYSKNSIPENQFRAIEDRAIAEALRRQRDTGLDIFSDGEMRRGSWLTDMAEAVEGFVRDRVILDWKGPTADPRPAPPTPSAASCARPVCSPRTSSRCFGPPRRGRSKSPSPRLPISCVSSYKAGLTERFYATHAALLSDLVDIIRDEIQWLVAQGAVYIQLDAPYYSHYLDPLHREQIAAAGSQSRPRACRRHRRRQRRARRHSPRPRHRGAARLPRQQPEPLVHRGRLRSDRRETVRISGRRPIPAGV